jgi:hypothetical protein
MATRTMLSAPPPDAAAATASVEIANATKAARPAWRARPERAPPQLLRVKDDILPGGDTAIKAPGRTTDPTNGLLDPLARRNRRVILFGTAKVRAAT